MSSFISLLQRKIVLNNPTLRTPICVFLVRGKNKYAGREARYMQRLLLKNSPKKKFRVFGDSSPSPTPSTFSDASKPKKHLNYRRIAVLNKLFMEHITNLLMGGNFGCDLLDRGIQITRVEISPDFHCLNVFWLSPPLDEDIEQLLDSVAKQIHHELTTLRLIGHIPKIVFLKDTRKEKIMQVESLLLRLQKERESLGIEDQEGPLSPIEEEIPSMTNDVYGLDHTKIMKKIGFDTPRKGKSSRTPTVDSTEENQSSSQNETKKQDVT